MCSPVKGNTVGSMIDSQHISLVVVARFQVSKSSVLQDRIDNDSNNDEKRKDAKEPCPIDG